MHDKKVFSRLVRIEKKLLKFWVKDDQVVRKSIMVMSHLASALVEQEAVILSQEITDLLIEINEIIVTSYDRMPEIKAIDISAAKQAPKVLKLLQEEGLFN